jgi:hypothetical protein
MSLPTTIPQAVLDTVLNRLALLFLAGAAGDPATARHAATHMLAAYHPETPNELSLASEIISFSFHALEALGDAATPDLSMNKILRLRGSAVSLSRESHKAQRKLDQLQRARRDGTQQQPTEAQPTPAAAQALSTASTSGKITWTQAYQQRLRANRMAENAKKNQAQPAHRDAPATTAQVQLSG